MGRCEKAPERGRGVANKVVYMAVLRNRLFYSGMGVIHM